MRTRSTFLGCPSWPAPGAAHRGGDGGSPKSCSYPGIERIVIAELDAKVVDIARRLGLDAVHHGARRSRAWRSASGTGWPMRASMPAAGERYDLIVPI